MSTSDLQDLADIIGELKDAAAGEPFRLELTFTLGDESRPADQIPDEVLKKLNELLSKASDKLQLE